MDTRYGGAHRLCRQDGSSGLFHIADAYNDWGWYIDALEIWRGTPQFTGDFEAGWVDWSASKGIWQIGTPTGGPDGCYEGTQCAGTIIM